MKYITLIVFATSAALLSLAPAIDSDLEDAAVAKMSADGYSVIELSWASIDDDQWLVVKYGWNRYMTNEVPWGLNKYSTDKGKYWAKTKTFGGLNSIVDEDGKEHTFTFAKWKELD